jgi:hypothetical protein
MKDRGYGLEHQQERKRWASIVAAGQAVCTRCKQPIAPGANWHLDHTNDRLGYLGVAHASCNIRAANELRAARARAYVQALQGQALDGLPDVATNGGARVGPRPRFPDPQVTFPDPEPGNTVDRWSQHWGGPANPRCPYCRALNGPCPDADKEVPAA